MAANTFFRYDTWVKSATGPAVAGAQVFVCTQPANTALFPPTPLASIYSDSGGLVPITQPIITDGFGHANFYALPGLYTVVIALNGVIQQVYPDQSLGGIGTAGGGGGGISGSILLETNGVPNANQLVLNVVGSGSTVVTNDGLGDTTITNTPVNVVAVPLGFWVPNGNSVSASGQYGGFLFGSAPWNNASATTTEISPTSTTPLALNVKNTNSGGGNFGSIGAVALNLQSVARLRWSLMLEQTTNMRIWMGLATNAGIGFANDTLSSAFAGFRYSTHAGDTKYQCVTNTGSAQTTTPESTSSHVDATTYHVFEIQYVAPNVLFFIDGVQVGSQSTNLPPSTTTIGFFASIDNVGVAGQPSYNLAWATSLSNF